jgi:hypothetical protein
MKTTTDYIIKNRKGSVMACVNTEAEAKAIVEKNAKRGWNYVARTFENTAAPWWAMAGYNADPTTVEYGTGEYR